MLMKCSLVGFMLSGCCKDIGGDRCRIDSLFSREYCVYHRDDRREVCYDEHGNINYIEDEK